MSSGRATRSDSRHRSSQGGTNIKCAAIAVVRPSLRGAPIEQELLRQAWLGRGEGMMHFCNAPSVRCEQPRQLLDRIGSQYFGASLRRLRKSMSDLICRQARFLSERPIMSHFAPGREMASFLLQSAPSGGDRSSADALAMGYFATPLQKQSRRRPRRADATRD